MKRTSRDRSQPGKRLIWGISILVLALLLSGAIAETAGAGEEMLARLFFSPEERAVLERLRKSAAEPDVAAAIKEDVAEKKPRMITLGGTVTRKNRKNGENVADAVWLNDRQYPTAGLPARVKVDNPVNPGEIVLLVPNTGKRYALRSGQTLDPDSGRITEVFEPLPQDPTATKDGAVIDPTLAGVAGDPLKKP